MIDHISLRVQDFSRALDFYKAALAPLGYTVLMEFPNVAGLGTGGKPDLWIMQSEQTTNPTHIALNGERPQIDEFHVVALQSGGNDNGGPGLRPDYHPHYYAAFVLDPEGNNIEVVCHDPEGATAVVAGTKKAAKAAKMTAKSAKKAVKVQAKATKKAIKATKKATKKAEKKSAKKSTKKKGR